MSSSNVSSTNWLLISGIVSAVIALIVIIYFVAKKRSGLNPSGMNGSGLNMPPPPGPTTSSLNSARPGNNKLI